MPDELENRIRAALRAEVADLPLAVTPSMVEERLSRSSAFAWGPSTLLATMAGVLVVTLAAGVALLSERAGSTASGTEPMIVRSNEPIGQVEDQPRICIVARRDESNELAAWWYAPGDGSCDTTTSSLTLIDDAVAPSDDDANAYSLHFPVQVATGELDFVEIATTLHFPQGESPYFATVDGPVGITELGEVNVPAAFGSLESPLATPVAAPTASPKPPGPLGDCPVTQPQTTPPEIGERLWGWHSAYGNDDLWVGGLGQDGIIALDERSVHSDGSIGTKLGWWRNVSGSVQISGRRLDAPAPALQGQGSEGYGRIGFQASGVDFPTEGCWEVTGRVGDAELTFVTYVVNLDAEVDRLFTSTETCTTTLADHVVEVTLPEAWSANEPTDDQPGCIWFGPTPSEAEASSGAPPPGVAITLGSVGGPEEPRSGSVRELSREELIVSGRPAARVELAEPKEDAPDVEVIRLTYWVSVGPNTDAGPTIVATTSTDAAGNYPIYMAVLDRIMDLVVINDG
jgi:hypothetical protein